MQPTPRAPVIGPTGELYEVNSHERLRRLAGPPPWDVATSQHGTREAWIEGCRCRTCATAWRDGVWCGGSESNRHGLSATGS
jgi:hypothetical protein